MAESWERYPELKHLSDNPGVRGRMQRRRRHRGVRYILFRFKDIMDRLEKGEPGVELTEAEKHPGFLEFWLDQRPAYQMTAAGKKVAVDPKRDRLVKDMGGYKKFAVLWDVDEDLEVYLRHNSVWAEWDAKMLARTPILTFDPS
jgi:hypothetical protein